MSTRINLPLSREELTRLHKEKEMSYKEISSLLRKEYEVDVSGATIGRRVRSYLKGNGKFKNTENTYTIKDLVYAIQDADSLCEGRLTVEKYKEIRRKVAFRMPSYNVIYQRVGFHEAMRRAGIDKKPKKKDIPAQNEEQFCKDCVEEDCCIDLELCDYYQDYKEGVIDAC